MLHIRLGSASFDQQDISVLHNIVFALGHDSASCLDEDEGVVTKEIRATLTQLPLSFMSSIFNMNAIEFGGSDNTMHFNVEPANDLHV